jgi:transcriptional regulator GlxA family with amidase domain
VIEKTTRGHLHQEQAAHGAILEATWLLRRQLDPQPVIGVADDGKERLLAWQVRKVLDYIDGHITSRVLVADLCALVWRSEAHFSRSFRATFGYSPHAFVIRRRVELAAKYMLQTDMSLSDIALGVDLWITRICAITFEWSLGKRRPPGDVRKRRKAQTWNE